MRRSNQGRDAGKGPAREINLIRFTLAMLLALAATGLAAQDDAAGQGAARVAALEADRGPYDPQLGEELASLGLVHAGRGEHGAALQALRRALQIRRVNEGLHSAGQIPILERIIESQTVLEDWEGLDQSYHYLYWVHRRSFDADDVRLLPVLERIGRWKLEALSLGVGGSAQQHVDTAGEVFERAVAIAEQAYGGADPRLVRPLYGQALVSLQLAAYAREGLAGVWEDLHTGGRTITRDFELERLQRLYLESYRRGRDALERVANIHAAQRDVAPLEQALAYSYLGDWYLMFDRRNDAAESYGRAWQVLRAAGVPEAEIGAMFAEPVPALNLDLDDRAQGTGEGSPRVEGRRTRVKVRFDVTSKGLARNVEVVDSDPPGRSALERDARRRVASVRFRPRLEQGRPAPARDVMREYVFVEREVTAQ